MGKKRKKGHKRKAKQKRSDTLLLELELPSGQRRFRSISMSRKLLRNVAGTDNYLPVSGRELLEDKIKDPSSIINLRYEKEVAEHSLDDIEQAVFRMPGYNGFTREYTEVKDVLFEQHENESGVAYVPKLMTLLWRGVSSSQSTVNLDEKIAGRANFEREEVQQAKEAIRTHIDQADLSFTVADATIGNWLAGRNVSVTPSRWKLYDVLSAINPEFSQWYTSEKKAQDQLTQLREGSLEVDQRTETPKTNVRLATKRYHGCRSALRGTMKEISGELHDNQPRKKQDQETESYSTQSGQQFIREVLGEVHKQDLLAKVITVRTVNPGEKIVIEDAQGDAMKDGLVYYSRNKPLEINDEHAPVHVTDVRELYFDHQILSGSITTLLNIYLIAMHGESKALGETGFHTVFRDKYGYGELVRNEAEQVDLFYGFIPGTITGLIDMHTSVKSLLPENLSNAAKRHTSQNDALQALKKHGIDPGKITKLNQTACRLGYRLAASMGIPFTLPLEVVRRPLEKIKDLNDEHVGTIDNIHTRYKTPTFGSLISKHETDGPYLGGRKVFLDMEVLPHHIAAYNLLKDKFEEHADALDNLEARMARASRFFYGSNEELEDALTTGIYIGEEGEFVYAFTEAEKAANAAMCALNETINLVHMGQPVGDKIDRTVEHTVRAYSRYVKARQQLKSALGNAKQRLAIRKYFHHQIYVLHFTLDTAKRIALNREMDHKFPIDALEGSTSKEVKDFYKLASEASFAGQAMGVLSGQLSKLYGTSKSYPLSFISSLDFALQTMALYEDDTEKKRHSGSYNWILEKTLEQNPTGYSVLTPDATSGFDHFRKTIGAPKTF